MKKKPVSHTTTGKSNSVLRNFLTNLKENELHYENKQITQCVFLGVLRLKPVPSIFSSTNVPSSGASVIRSKPRKAKNNNSNKEVNKNVPKKTSINKVINGKITKKNCDKVRASVKKSPAKKSKFIKIQLNMRGNDRKVNIPDNREDITVESENLSQLIPGNLNNKQPVKQNSKTSTTFNPVDSLLNKLKQKIDVGHSSGLGLYDVIDRIQGTQTESSTPVRRKLILPTKSKSKPKPTYHQSLTMSNSNISNENLNKDKDDVIFVTDYKLEDSIIENMDHSCDDIIFIDTPRAVKQKERKSPRNKVSNIQDPVFNGEHPRTATTIQSNLLNSSVGTQNNDIIIISDDFKSRPSTPNDLIIVDDSREIRVSPRLKKSMDSYGHSYVTTMPSRNKIDVISDQDFNKSKCNLDKSRNQELNLAIDTNLNNTYIENTTVPLLRTVDIKKMEDSSNRKNLNEKVLQKPVEKPKQRRSRLMAANIPSIFLNTPMLLRSELAQKKNATASKPKNREKAHPRFLRSELPKNSLLSKSFSEEKVVRQDRTDMRKCASQENLFVPKESETICGNDKLLISQKNIEQKKHSSPQLKNTTQKISKDRWEITKSTPNVEAKNKEIKSNQKPSSLKLTLTKTSKTSNRSPTPKEKSSKNQETQTEKDIYVIQPPDSQHLVDIPGNVLNLRKDVNLNVPNNPMYSTRLLRSDLSQKSPTLNSVMTNTKVLENVAENTNAMDVIIIPDDKKDNEKCVETFKNVVTAISPRLLRSNIPQQNNKNGKDTIALSNLITQNVGNVELSDKVIPEKINLEQNNSNLIQNSKTHSVCSRKFDESFEILYKNVSKNIHTRNSVINQGNSLSSEDYTSTHELKQDSSSPFQESTTFAIQQNSASPNKSAHPQQSTKYLNQSQECNSTDPPMSIQNSNQLQETTTLISTQRTSLLTCDSTSPQTSQHYVSEPEDNALSITNKKCMSLSDSSHLQELKQSPTGSQASTSSITNKQSTVSSQTSTNSEVSKYSSKKSPIKNRSLQKKAAINFDEIVVLNEKRSKKIKEYPSRLLRSDFHQPTISKLSKVIKSEEVVVLIHDEPKSKCLPSPKLSRNDTSSECSTNNVVEKMSSIDSPILTQRDIAISDSFAKSNKIISEKDISPVKEFSASKKSMLLENNNNNMAEYKVENIKTPNSLITQTSKSRNELEKKNIHVKLLQSTRDTHVIESEEVQTRNLRSQKCSKTEDVIEIKNNSSQKSKSRKDEGTAIPDVPIPRRILRCTKGESVENVIATPEQKKTLRTQSIENKVSQKLDEPVSQKALLRSQKNKDIKNLLLTVNSNNHEIKEQYLNNNSKELTQRILRSKKGEQGVVVSKMLKRRERNKSEKNRLSQNKGKTSLTMVKQNAVRTSKALVEKKLALRDLRHKILARAREFKNKKHTKSSNEKVIKKIKDITILKTNKASILRGKKIVPKHTRKNKNILNTIENKKQNGGSKKISGKIDSRPKQIKKRKCVQKFLPTKKVLKRKCKERSKGVIKGKPSLAVKMLNHSMKSKLLRSQKLVRNSIDKKEKHIMQTLKTKSTHEEKKGTLSCVEQKNPRIRGSFIQNNPTIKKKPNSNVSKNDKKTKGNIPKENEQKNVPNNNRKKSSKNQKEEKYYETLNIDNEEKHRKESKIIVCEAVNKSVQDDESITKRKGDQTISESAIPKRLRKTSSKEVHTPVSTIVDRGKAQVNVSKRLRNCKDGFKENSIISPSSIDLSKTLIEQVNEVTEIQTKCTDCNKTIIQKIPCNKTNSVVDCNSTVSKNVADSMSHQGADTISNSNKNRDITVFDFNETELEPVVPPMRFNSPKKDKSLKTIQKHDVSEKHNKSSCRKLELMESPTHAKQQATETLNASEENTHDISRTEEVTKKKLYSRIDNPDKSVAKIRKSKTRTAVTHISSQNENLKEISLNLKSKEKINTKEKTPGIKSETKLYSLIEKPPKKSINIEATNISISAEESSNPKQDINGSSTTTLAETNTDKKPSPKKSPMKQATITDMFNKMKLKKDQSSAVRNVFSSPVGKEPRPSPNENSKDSQSSSKIMPPPKIELPWNKGAAVEDDDSDCESRMEWMPEEYAEYKFKYTAKKLMTNKPIFQCRFCLLTLPSYYFLNKHKLKHLETDKPYKCQQCEETFGDVVEYTAHIRIHKGKHPYTCKKCDERFWTKNDYDAHMPVHILKKMKTPEKKYRCDVCGKTFSKLCDVERHTRVHTGEKPCVCNICNKRFQQSHNLSKHLLIHLDIKPFNCEICNKQFSRLDILDRHILTHSVKKPAMCQHCPKGFIRQSQLDVHMKKYHPNAERNVKQERVPVK